VHVSSELVELIAVPQPITYMSVIQHGMNALRGL